MFKSPKGLQARQVAKWCVYGLALATPGSFVVLPLWLLHRHRASRAAWKKASLAANKGKPLARGD